MIFPFLIFILSYYYSTKYSDVNLIISFFILLFLVHPFSYIHLCWLYMWFLYIFLLLLYIRLGIIASFSLVDFLVLSSIISSLFYIIMNNTFKHFISANCIIFRSFWLVTTFRFPITRWVLPLYFHFCICFFA